MSFSLADITRRLQRGLNLSETEANAILSRLVPTLDVAELLGDASSDSFTYRFASGGMILGAVALEFTEAKLSNLAGSGVLLVVTDVMIATPGNSGGAASSHSTTAGGGRVANAQGFRDNRMKGDCAGHWQIRNNVAGSGTDRLHIYPTDSSNRGWRWDGSGRNPVYIIDEGDQINFGTINVNTALTISASWLEISRGPNSNV